MFTPIIGLEIHLQLKTKSKAFCSCPTVESEPNTNICPICLGYPGTMPSLNKEAVKQSIKMGLALNCEIAKEANWDRKNYMYPDLFKGYQISQLDNPICGEGKVEFIVRDRKNFYSKECYTKTVGISRAHLEEDTAKSLHQDDITFIDANKAGVPLLEIVSKPEMYSVDEAVSYAKTIKSLAKWYKISDCNLELGQMRFDANISICVDDIDLKGKTYEEWKGATFTPVVEIKNLNSFGNLEAALQYEINRQIEEYKKTKEIYKPGNKETRGWDEKKGVSYIQRRKEEANEYRYIPEPDIPTLIITEEDILQIKNEMGKNPKEVYSELIETGLNEQSARLISEEINYYEIYSYLSSVEGVDKVRLGNLITNELNSEIIQIENNENFGLWLDGLKKVVLAFSAGEISRTELKEILKNHKIGQNDWENLLECMRSTEIVDVESILKRALLENSSVVSQIKSGKESAKMFFIGIVMRETKGKANPKKVKDLIDELINCT